LADISVTVDPDGTGDYTSLSSAEATEQATYADLVGDNNTMTFNCTSSGGTADTTSVWVSGWNTDATYFITIDNIDGHEGKRPTTTYRIDISAAYASAIGIEQNYTVVNGIAASNDGGTAGYTFRARGDYCKFLNCIGYDCEEHMYYLISGFDHNVFINCIAINSSKDGFHSESAFNYCYNCVSIANTGYGFYCGAYDDFYLKNCYAGGNTGADFYEEALGDMQVTTCFSEDGTESTTTAAYSTSAGAYFTNVTAGSEDINLTSTSSSLYNSGTDLSADGVYPFDFDYEDTTRSGWCVGPHEYIVAGGGLSIPIAMHHYKMMRH